MLGLQLSWLGMISGEQRIKNMVAKVMKRIQLGTVLKKTLLVSLMVPLVGCSILHLPIAHPKGGQENLYIKERMPALLTEADDFYRAGNLPAAEDKYLAVIELDAKQSRALYRLGNIAFKLAQYEKARDYFARTVNADPGNSKAHYNLAVTNITLAQEHFKAYVAGEPDNIHRPQIESLMRHIDEFAQDKPSDAKLPAAVQNMPAQTPAVSPQPKAVSVQPAAKKTVKKPKRKIMKRVEPQQQEMPALPKQEAPQIKSPVPLAAQPKTKALPAEVDPLDALASQLKSP